MNNIIHILLIRVVDLFTFSHSDKWNKRGRCVTLMRLAALSSWCFDVAMWYFEEILLDLKNNIK